MNLLHIKPDKIIVRMPNWIGDLVMATPILTDLKNRFPRSEITVMCESPLCDLLKEDKDVDEIFSFTRERSRFLRRKEKRNIVAKLREGNYDLGILTTNSFSSAWWFWKGGVKNRIGFSKHFRRFLLNHTIPYPKEEQHQVVTYKQLIFPLGVPVSDTLPRLFLKDEEIACAKELLEQRGVTPDSKIIALSPGAAYGPAKRWPDEKFFRLTKSLLEIPHVNVVFLGDETVTPLAKSISRTLGDKVIDLTAATSLRMLCSLIKITDVFLTNDSGPMHIAAALKVPMIALFGSTSPKRTRPYMHGEVIYRKESCSPCYKRECPIDFPCMKKITVEEVYQKIQSLLQ